MSLQYTLVGAEDGTSNLSVFVPGYAPQVAHSSHPNFDAILGGVLLGDESVITLFDIAESAGKKFERLTERVTTANGRLYLDGEEVHNALASQVVRFLAEGVDDWKPLVRFFENVQANPQEHSREQLYDWLAKRDFTITDSGLIVGYKGVEAGENEGEYLSIHSGKAIVDGVEFSGRIPQGFGSVVEMPRGSVAFDPSQGCSTGLHVGTYEYANGFSRGSLLEVHVNPRDVVSVPTDCDWAKVRVCRYVVVGLIDKPYSESVISTGVYDWDDDFDWGFESEPDESSYLIGGEDDKGCGNRYCKSCYDDEGYFLG